MASKARRLSRRGRAFRRAQDKACLVNPDRRSLASRCRGRPPDLAKVCRRPRSRNAKPRTQSELEALWRTGGPLFIGPVAPPMWLWVHDQKKQALWRKAHGLS